VQTESLRHEGAEEHQTEKPAGEGSNRRRKTSSNARSPGPAGAADQAARQEKTDSNDLPRSPGARPSSTRASGGDRTTTPATRGPRQPTRTEPAGQREAGRRGVCSVARKRTWRRPRQVQLQVAAPGADGERRCEGACAHEPRRARNDLHDHSRPGRGREDRAGREAGGHARRANADARAEDGQRGRH